MKVKQLGFSMMEMLIALTVGTFLLAGVMAVYIGMRSTTSSTLATGEMQENARLAISLIKKDIFHSGFWGHFTQPTPRADDLVWAAPSVGSDDCVGEDLNNASFPVNVAAPFRYIWSKTSTSSSELGCISDAKIGSDILQVKRIMGPAVAVRASNRPYFIANTESAGFILGDGAVPVVVANSSQWEYVHHVYYVRTQDGIPTLMQKRLLVSSGVATISGETLLDGVEQLAFMFGVDFNGDASVDRYYTADNVPDAVWDPSQSGAAIVAAKIFVLVRSINEDKDFTDTASYKLAETTFGPYNDHYRRLLVSTTVRLNNVADDSWQ